MKYFDFIWTGQLDALSLLNVSYSFFLHTIQLYIIRICNWLAWCLNSNWLNWPTENYTHQKKRPINKRDILKHPFNCTSKSNPMDFRWHQIISWYFKVIGLFFFWINQLKVCSMSFKTSIKVESCFIPLLKEWFLPFVRGRNNWCETVSWAWLAHNFRAEGTTFPKGYQKSISNVSNLDYKFQSSRKLLMCNIQFVK